MSETPSVSGGDSLAEIGHSLEDHVASPDAMPLRVLAVDSDELALASLSTFAQEEFVVTTAGSIEQARYELASGEIDCIVAEYGLPDGSSTELLDQLRAEGSDVPFVLFTDIPTELIAADAIESDVAKLVKKDCEQPDVALSDAINAATDDRRGLGDSPFGDLNDELVGLLLDAGIYLWDWDLARGTVKRWPSTEQLFDVAKSELEPVFDGFIRCVDSGHRESLKATLQQAIESGESYRTTYRLDIPHHPRVWIEEYGIPITDREGTATNLVGVARDVTESERRREDLEWERNLNRTFREALGQLQDRSELERTVAQLLSDYGYSVVWIGEWRADELRPRAVVGDDSIVDALDLNTPIPESAHRPTVRAARTSDPQFFSTFKDRTQKHWYREAYRQGIRGVGSLPLVHNGVFYGVVSVLTTSSGGFKAATRRHLSGLADTLAAVIHDVETRRSLAADRCITTTLQLDGVEYYLQDVLDRVDGAAITVEETIPQNDTQTVQYCSVEGASVDRFVDLAGDHGAVETATIVDGDAASCGQVLHGQETPETVLAALGVRVRSTRVEPRRVELTVETETKRGISAAVEALESHADHVTVRSCIERQDRSTSTPDDPLSTLTDRQRTVLRAAYQQGYFEQPRQNSATDVAESLDISHPTLLEHLRRAQGKLFAEQFEPTE